MIRYQLVCKCKHEFESWFRSSSDFDRQCDKGLLACPACGSDQVSKALMAPNVATSKQKQAHQPSLLQTKEHAEVVQAVRELRSTVEENSEYVGKEFSDVARKIHHGEEPERWVHGEASLNEVKDLSEEGIPVVPLPSLPEDKN